MACGAVVVVVVVVDPSLSKATRSLDPSPLLAHVLVLCWWTRQLVERREKRALLGAAVWARPSSKTRDRMTVLERERARAREHAGVR